MAFDAAFTCAIINEISTVITGARIEKIFQPSKESVLLSLHCERNGNIRGSTVKLLIDAGASNPRISICDPEFDNPKVPPMLCMLLRKHLGCAKIVSVKSLGFDRCAELEFETRDEMGFLTRKYLITEIMGKFSNLIFLDSDRKIITALKTNDVSSFGKRAIMPGMVYSPPPAQEGRISPLDETREHFVSALAESEQTPDKFIMSNYCGLAPLVAREISYRAGSDPSPEVLADVFFETVNIIKSKAFTPVLLCRENGVPFEYSFMPIYQYGRDAEIKICGSFSELIESFFSERAHAERIKQRASDILHLLVNAESRLNKKIAAQRADLDACTEKELFKRNGDLITANIYRLQRGMSEAEVTDYFDPDCPTVTITLDTRLSPSQNAQRYYKRYNKCKSAEVNLTAQLEIAERELKYIDTVFESLSKAENENDLAEIRRELFESGYASRMKSYKAAKIPAPKPMEFVTSGGYRVLCGKNNSQNDYLTHKLADKNDVWFHVKDMAGSHVIMICGGEEPNAEDYTEAAIIAAVYSKAPLGQKVTVDYTEVKNIKKPPASKPGFVTFKTNYSAYVIPDKALADRLRRK